MKMTPEEAKQSDDSYAQAFNEDAPAKPEQSEDEAFGITADAPADATAPAGGEAPGKTSTPVALVIEDTAAAGEPAGQTSLEAKADQEQASEGEPRSEGDGGVDISMASPGEAAVESHDPVVEPSATGADGQVKAPMTEQQLRSWEGRLKKAQSELDAKGKTTTETPSTEAIEEVAEQAEDTNPAMAEAAEQMADRVEDGTMTAAQAMKQLTEDFGEDFVKMIETIARDIAMQAGSSAAESKVGEVRGAVDDIIAHISDGAAKKHFEEIAAAHPDFSEVAKSEGFKQFIDNSPNAEESKRIATGGSAAEINKLLDEYKASLQQATPEQEQQAAAPAADPVVDAQADAAEGVRSTGMALPDQPASASKGYEDAWAEF